MWTSLRSTIEEGVREFSRDALQEVRTVPKPKLQCLCLVCQNPVGPTLQRVCCQRAKGGLLLVMLISGVANAQVKAVKDTAAKVDVRIAREIAGRAVSSARNAVDGCAV